MLINPIFVAIVFVIIYGGFAVTFGRKMGLIAVAIFAIILVCFFGG